MGKGEHAVVLGAGMGGLLAARVLADAYDRVTIVERDRLSPVSHNRRGVPQGRHVHGLLPGGANAVDELFPGLLEELVEWGATKVDDYTRFRFVPDGTHRLSPLLEVEPIYQPSRPFFESGVRARVLQLGNVDVLDGTDIIGLVADASRVTGVRVGEGEVLTADLVVDATGRGSRTPAWLAELGYERPAEDEVPIDVRYTSTPVRLAQDAVPDLLTVIGARPDRPAGMALAAYENGTWIFTVYGYGDHHPAPDFESMVDFAEGIAPPHMIAALRTAEPLGDTSTFRFRANRRRRYDRLRRFPKGLLVFGDAMCAFNPIYGQGMTVSALEAMVLRDCLRGGDRGLARRFFRRAAKPIQVAWNMAVGADLALPYVEGRVPLPMRLTNAYVGRVLVAAEHDPVVAAQFLQVAAFVDKPPRLMTPSMVASVIAANRKANRLTSAAPDQPVPSAVSR
jgi:2-polyprenyl-6-methoxyphenol hydroxylase-like FAD-dependent oxidoreductase